MFSVARYRQLERVLMRFVTFGGILREGEVFDMIGYLVLCKNSPVFKGNINFEGFLGFH